MDKRSFLKTFTLAGLATPLSGSALGKWIDTAAGIPAETLLKKYRIYTVAIDGG